MSENVGWPANDCARAMKPGLCFVGRRIAALLVAAALALAGFIGPAGAHASLVSSEPRDRAVVDVAPPRLLLTFNEPVSPLSLKLIGADGGAVALHSFELKDRTLEIAAPAGLARGTHVLSWRVVSEDGHPVAGSVVFSIGEASTTPATPAESADWIVRAGLWTGRIALYLGLFLGTGGAFAVAWLIRDGAAATDIIRAALITGAVGALVSLGFQGLDAMGEQAGRILDPAVWFAGMGTGFGRTVVAAVAALAAAALALLAGGPISRLLSLAGLLLTGVALSLSGHASAAEPQWLTRPMVFLHGSAIAFWAGALLPLCHALKHEASTGAAALRRFSAAIPWVVAILVMAGTVLAVVQIEHPAALLDTAYGNVFLVKIALLVALLGLAAVNRWRLTRPTEAGDAVAARKLIRSVAAETALVLLIFAVAACWRFTPPPRALAIAAAQPAFVHIHTAKAMADVTVTPVRAGSVDVAIIVMTGEFDPLDAKEVTLVVANPTAGIEPIRRPARKTADIAWHVDGLVLPVAGTWDVRVDILVGDFEMARLEGELRIRP